MTSTLIPPDLAFDTAAYRRALGSFATGVCVVTADGPAGPTGITVNSFTSVSLDPPLVLWCIDDRSERRAVFAAAQTFTVHMLTAGDEALARRFTRGEIVLGDDEFVRSGDGPPCLAQAMTWLECTTHQLVPLGDHTVIVGRVARFDTRPGAALTYFRGRFGTATDPADQG